MCIGSIYIIYRHYYTLFVYPTVHSLYTHQSKEGQDTNRCKPLPIFLDQSSTQSISTVIPRGNSLWATKNCRIAAARRWAENRPAPRLTTMTDSTAWQDTIWADESCRLFDKGVCVCIEDKCICLKPVQ